ncbi:8868_t:CDS:2 [Ambispora leptoticha]|uniref:8868_t:CDS:1 n=1 Tax=Ambispora leptoticha TaxID=144679 RepID=A0A9N9A1F0_9GLOM|nr:8868_t:CDS:2 [Ambispora leptoticha]
MSQASYQTQPQMMQTNIQGTSTPAPTQPMTWKHGLFDCFNNMGDCCLACWCPCIIYGKTKSKADGSDETAQCCCFFCAMCIGFWCCLGTVNRGDLRNKKNIQGGLIEDAAIWWCCTPCALVQEHQEFSDSRGPTTLQLDQRMQQQQQEIQNIRQQQQEEMQDVRQQQFLQHVDNVLLVNWQQQQQNFRTAKSSTSATSDTNAATDSTAAKSSTTSSTTTTTAVATKYNICDMRCGHCCCGE